MIRLSPRVYALSTPIAAIQAGTVSVPLRSLALAAERVHQRVRARPSTVGGVSRGTMTAHRVLVQIQVASTRRAAMAAGAANITAAVEIKRVFIIQKRC